MDMFIDLTESDINKVIKHQDLIKELTQQQKHSTHNYLAIGLGL